jgi:branched-chain amino acid aminotransferase
MIATDVGLGVHPSHKYLIYIICAPSGAYYPRGLAPIRIYVEDNYVRAVKGGTGFAKTGGNYAASLKAADQAEQKGCEQVLWLDGAEQKYVEEVGSMNMMFIIDGKLCTAALGGTILPGITRDSILTLARELGLPTEERKIGIDELLQAAKSGALQEAFGSGTAAVVSPVGELFYKDNQVVIGGGEIGKWTKKLYDTLTDIQWGRAKDAHGWVTKV